MAGLMSAKRIAARRPTLPAGASVMFKYAYWAFAHLGLMTFSASFLMGFRYAPDAPRSNLWWNIALYSVFITIHIVMTMPAFKEAVYGNPAGSPGERRIYITVTVISWLIVFGLHLPIAGFALSTPAWLQYLGYCALLLAFFGFFEFVNFEVLASMLGVPGAPLAYSTGSETPLLTTGPYAQVRHPMYRAAFFIAFSSLLIHPHAGQLLFACLISASFIGFIPFEERQLLKARGEEYGAYMAKTPYRVFQGLW
jgi:protein-S-isoprenylcysteine O-methyltransferase Ste14